ncbi:MAG: DUF933 domain-containing protein [Candidatus Omnitrophica bacterium]|nr:DUF933 domain-containing protein [Candidatus Omnitrophota bacterium]
MHVGLIGLPQAGKKTLLRLLTGVDARADSGRGANGGVVPGICPVRDPRVDRLATLYHPAKVTPATIQYLLMPDLTKDSAKNQELFKGLLAVDVLTHVVRAFEDDTVFHVDGSVDPLRDIAMAQQELLLNDLLFVEKRLERIQQSPQGRRAVDRSREQAALAAAQAHLNEGRPLRTLALSEDDAKLLSGAPLLTRKPCVLILNVGEDAVADRRLLDEVRLLQALGLAESAIDRLTRVSYEALGLIAYFTVGTDEVRAWTVRRGASAAEAGGAIHSDIERGFIRAELMKYEDLIALGSEQAVAAAGKASLKGKEYVVEDGDVLSFRFNV